MSVDLIPAIKILERAQGHITFGFRAAAGDCDSGNEGLFFVSCSRRHTRFDCDWSSDVCSSDLKIGEHPHEIVVAPDNRTAYVSDNGILRMQYAGEGGNTISIVDLKDRKKIGVIDLGNYRR